MRSNITAQQSRSLQGMGIGACTAPDNKKCHVGFMSCALQGFHFIKNIRCIRVKPVLTILCGSVWPIIKRKSNFFLIFRSAARRTSACSGIFRRIFFITAHRRKRQRNSQRRRYPSSPFFPHFLPPDLSFPFSIIINHQTLL